MGCRLRSADGALSRPSSVGVAMLAVTGTGRIIGEFFQKMARRREWSATQEQLDRRFLRR